MGAVFLECDEWSPEDIYQKYKTAFRGNTQGCCLLIAEEIIQTNGGVAVAGELTWYGGNCRRTHWWVEIDGKVVDPMGDDFLSTEDATGRTEHHRDQNIFASLLPQYEKWRVY